LRHGEVKSGGGLRLRRKSYGFTAGRTQVARGSNRKEGEEAWV